MGHHVYKYVEDDEIIYIGKNDTDLHTRISQHVSEKKFKEHPDAKIYYGKLANSVESRFMEMMLINRYKPILNVVDKEEGDFNDYIKRCTDGYARRHEEACTLLEQYKNGEWK